MAASTIQYTGEQARTFAAVSSEAWRHWRKVVPSLSAKRGKKARFSAGEMIALAIVASVVAELDVGVSSLSSRWDELFSLCAYQHPSSFRSGFIVITAKSVQFAELDSLKHGIPAIVVACDPIVDRLWAAALSGGTEQAQAPLPFAPQVVRATRS